MTTPPLASKNINDPGNSDTASKHYSLNYLWSFLLVSAITLPGFWLRQTLETSTISIFYLLGVVGIAYWWGRGPAIAASFWGVLAVDYFITPPYFSFAMSSPQSWMNLIVMLVVSLVISTLAAQSRMGELHRVEAETEKNRSALLSAVSHDLRTPLTAIAGAASSLLEGAKTLTVEERRQLSLSIYEEAERMNRLVQNLLDMTRLESGALNLRKDWNSVEEVVGTALDRLKHRADEHPVALHLHPGLPLVSMDGLLVEQMLLNLLENAMNHTPPGTRITIGANIANGMLKLVVTDRGPGFEPGEEEAIFEKFTRGRQSGPRGVGLGLSICRGIAQAHGGYIRASLPPGGGARFTVTLPLEGDPPIVDEG